MRDLDTFRHVRYEVNGEDRTGEIISRVECTAEDDKVLYMVRNSLPLDYSERNATVVHKMAYTVPIGRFFQTYELLLPCRSFSLAVTIKNDADDRYVLRIGEFAPFGSRSRWESQEKLYGSHTNIFNMGNWALPGAGYSLALQKRTETGADGDGCK